MADKHTPGPWHRDARSGPGCDVRAASGRKVALCWGLASNNASNYRPGYRAECDANAHLIAAAPDLLEALKDCVAVMDRELAGLKVIQPELSAARAAIAKATGELQ